MGSNPTPPDQPPLSCLFRAMRVRPRYRKPFRGFNSNPGIRSRSPLLRARPPFSLVRYALGVYVGGGFHLGSTVRRWSPSLSFALLGRRGGRFLFDPVRSTFLLRRATLFLSKLVAKRGTLLLLAGAEPTLLKLRPLLRPLRFPLLEGRYRAGTLTNYKMAGLRRLPSAVFLLDRWRTAYSIREAALLRLPLIGFVDSDMDLAQLPYPIPANNDTPNGVAFLLRLLLQSHLAGRLAELRRLHHRRRQRVLRFQAAVDRFNRRRPASRGRPSSYPRLGVRRGGPAHRLSVRRPYTPRSSRRGRLNLSQYDSSTNR